MNSKKGLLRFSLLIFLVIGFFFFLPPLTLAKPSVHLVFPIRGGDFWQRPWSPVTKVKEYSNFLKQTQLPATFILRFDALNDPTITSLLKDNPSFQVGIFLEITPSLSKATNLPYPQGDNSWYLPDRIFTVSYSRPQRQKIIDAYFEKFQQIFHHPPALIGAWYLDSFSLNYIYHHYQVENFLLVSDQDGTDHYLIWGLPFTRNYHASFFNPLVPGDSPFSIYQWAPRNIERGLQGADQKGSLYSLQTNDYLKLGLNLDYWYSAIEDYSTSLVTLPFTLILGLENDEPNPLAYKQFFTAIRTLKNKGFVFTSKLGDSPLKFRDVFIHKGKGTTTYLVQNQNYRVYFKTYKDKTEILDLRSFLGNKYPSFWSFYPNKNDLLYAQTEAIIDQVQLGNKVTLPYPLEFDKQVKTFRSPTGAKIVFDNKQIKFFPEIPSNLSQRFKNFESLTIEKNKLIFGNFYQDQMKFNFLALVWLIIFLGVAFYILNNFFRPVENLFLLFLSFFWAVPLFRSGLLTKYGLGFWGPNGHDAIWHLALAQSIFKGFPLKHPTLAGQNLTNYHFGFDLVLASLHYLTHLPLTFLYFQILPLIIGVTILALSYHLYLKLFKTSKGAIFSLFFIVTAGSLGFIISFIKHQPLGGESAFWANQAISTLLNPPFASSLIFILVILLLLTKEKKSWWSYFLIFTLPAVTLWFKVYGGLFIFALVGFWSLLELKNKKNFKEIIVFGGIGTLIFLISLKLLTGSQSLIVFSPFWFVKTMFIFPDRVGWIKFGQALTAYLQSRNPKLILALPLALVIFYLGNFGTRILSVSSFKHLNSENKNVLLPLWLGIVLFSLIPLFIIQKGTPWNSIQFLYYPLFFTSFLSGTILITFKNSVSNLGFRISDLFGASIFGFKIFWIILFTIPTTISTLSYYLPKTPHAILPWEEVKALQFLSRQPDGDIITPPFNPYLKDIYNNPTPLFAYADTAYITAFSGKIAYLADTMNLDISGYNYQKRQNLLKQLYDPTLPDSHRNQALATITQEDPNIKYLYLLHLPAYKLTPPSPWHKIYQNSLVEVWGK